MQVREENFFYHSNARVGSDGGLEDERQRLVKEQKLCRARAHKFSLETNRRRKALEERQKQWDKQEQRLRQNILQQRRQRVQDATERFQRAHLPPSQRYRQTFGKNGPNIEDALNQIQGKLSSCSRQFSLSYSNSNVSRSCTPSPKPPTVSQSSSHQVLSAVEAYSEPLQEQNMACFKNSQQREKTEQKEQNHSPQDSHLRWSNSESISSKDSLENDDPDHSTKNQQCSHLSFPFDSAKPHPGLSRQNYVVPTTFSAMKLLGNNLPQSRNLCEEKQRKQEDSEECNNKMHACKTSWGFTSSEQTFKTEPQHAHRNGNLKTVSEIISADPVHCEENSAQNSHNDDIIVTNVIAPGNTTLQLDLKQQKVYDDRQFKHATQILMSSKTGNNKDILFVVPKKPNTFFNNIDNNTAGHASQEETLQQTGKEIHCLTHQEEPSASINNLNKVSELEAEKPINTESLQRACLSNVESDSLKCLKHPGEEVQNLPVSVGTSHSVHKVRFIKGILKKSSKYASGDVYSSGHFVFGKQVAVAIRDSVELTREKTKEVGSNHCVKKKLRWFDEVQVAKEDKKQDVIKQDKSSSLRQSSHNSEDHQLSLTTVSGGSRPGLSLTPPASTGYHFTKQAWADAGVQVSLPQKGADEVKVPLSSTRTGGSKVPRREHSSSRTRKGTVVRPQSAAEVCQIAKTQGKIIVPHPPHRMELVEEKMKYITRTPYGLDHPSVNCKQALTVEQASHKDNSEGFFSPYTNHVIRTDSAVLYTPRPPSYARPISEGNVKVAPRSSRQATQGCGRRTGTVLDEKGLCLHCTPTDEEISQLWHGVRSALSTKDAKTKLRRQALESWRQVARKPCVEQSRQPCGSGNKRFPQPSQYMEPTKQTMEPVRIPSSDYGMAFPEGLGATRLHLAKVRAEGLLEEMAAMETGQMHRSVKVPECSKQQGLTTLSLEEQKILLSLDRLDHQLLCLQQHVGDNTGTRDLVQIDRPSTREIKATNHQKHRASSVNNNSQHKKGLT